MEKEIWKDIKGYDGYYQISNKGRVRSLKCKGPNNEKDSEYHLLSLKTEELGYKRTTLFKAGVRKIHSIHRLVAKHFIPNPDNKPQVGHLDNNPSNNNISNLEWNTQSENILYAFSNGRKVAYKGEKHVSSKLTRDEVLEIRSAYDLGCFTQRELAEAYNISQSIICKILNRESWKHI